MRVEDLMIGDWVWVERPGPGREGKYARVEAIRDRTNVETSDRLRFVGELDGIPLTEKILLANGWTKVTDGDQPYRVKRYRGPLSLKHYPTMTWTVFDEFANIYCVHELQHALRLLHYDDQIVLTDEMLVR